MSKSTAVAVTNATNYVSVDVDQWFTKEQCDGILTALNTMGLALAEHNHQWTPEERSLYEKATRLLK